MRLRVHGAHSVAAGEVNEDGLLVRDDEAWVLDGASGLAAERVTDGPTDAAWLTRRALALLADRAPSGLRDALGPVVADLRAALGTSRRPHEVPSASLAAVRLTGTTLEALTLGDCRLLLRSPGAPTEVVDDAAVLESLDRAAIEAVVRERARSGVGLAETRTRVGDLLRANRDRMNAPGGYRALAPSLDVDGVTVGHRAVAAGTVGLLASDGYLRLIDTFHVFDADGLLDATLAEGGDALIARLRALEVDDPDGDRAPRLKTSDDATVVAFEVLAD